MSLWKPISSETIELRMTKIKRVEAIESDNVLLVKYPGLSRLKFEAKDSVHLQQLLVLFNSFQEVNQGYSDPIIAHRKDTASICSISDEESDFDSEDEDTPVVVPSSRSTLSPSFSLWSFPLTRSRSLSPISIFRRRSLLSPDKQKKNDKMKSALPSPPSLCETRSLQSLQQCTNSCSRSPSPTPLSEGVWESLLSDPDQPIPTSPTSCPPNSPLRTSYSSNNVDSVITETSKSHSLIQRGPVLHKMDMNGGGIVRRRSRSGSTSSTISTTSSTSNVVEENHDACRTDVIHALSGCGSDSEDDIRDVMPPAG
eukprot:CAMPEP_0185023532 /NCGR_PEP_ID=MMETSP1103-20130426/6193_1 /TAXON_ID=36769 /ORGANISM="Paraphysomonas bandaiensis, Strain Caron Lab Isolate" /LENGTH=311 /DNA_ID=CAMNT_0027556163 /DNA_START=343 /DNA_END=1278 /DNA_ORIENTATION=+